MASQTFGNYRHDFTLWESSYDIETNTSVVSYAAAIHRNTSASYGAWGSQTATVVGAPVPVTFDFRTYVDLNIATGSFIVAHNPDGTGSASGSFTWPYHTTGMPGGTVSEVIALTTIPRNRIRVGQGAVWRHAEVYVGVNGEWKRGLIHAGVGGEWKMHDPS